MNYKQIVIKVGSYTWASLYKYYGFV